MKTTHKMSLTPVNNLSTDLGHFREADTPLKITSTTMNAFIPGRVTINIADDPLLLLRACRPCRQGHPRTTKVVVTQSESLCLSGKGMECQERGHMPVHRTVVEPHLSTTVGSPPPPSMMAGSHLTVAVHLTATAVAQFTTAGEVPRTTSSTLCLTVPVV